MKFLELNTQSNLLKIGFLVFLFLVPLAQSLKATSTVYPVNVVSVIAQYGFQQNGTARFSLDPQADIPHSAKLYLCGLDEWKSLVLSLQNRVSNVCNQPLETSCEVNGMDFLAAIQYFESYRIPRTDYYHFLLLTCGSTIASAPIHLNYTFMNPTNQSLSLETIPLPRIYLTFSALWLSLMSLWLVEWLSNFSRRSFWLHFLLGVVILLKGLGVGAACWLWSKCESGELCQLDTLQLKDYLYACSQSLFFVVLLLVSQGWKITKPKLTWEKTRENLLTFVVLFGVLLFLSMYYDVYLLVVLLILYFYLLPRIFANMGVEIRTLQRSLTQFERHVLLTGRYSEYRTIEMKLALFRSMNVAVLAYLALISILCFLKIIFSFYWRLRWLNFFNDECFELVVVVVVCWTLHPRKASQHLYDGDLPHMPDFDVQSLDELQPFSDPETPETDGIIIQLPSNKSSSLSGPLSFAIPFWVKKPAPSTI